MQTRTQENRTQALGPYTCSFGLSLAITAVFNGLLVIVKETLEDSVLAWMKTLTGHHWLSHGLLVLCLFVVLGFALPKCTAYWQAHPDRLAIAIAGGIVLGSLLIVGFYL